MPQHLVDQAEGIFKGDLTGVREVITNQNRQTNENSNNFNLKSKQKLLEKYASEALAKDQ